MLKNHATNAEARADFSDRLRTAAFAAQVPLSPTQFARAFNVRAGENVVTLHAVRKWMVGESIPTQDKVVILAAWLGVGAAWLRFGEGEAEGVPSVVMPESTLATADLALLRAIASLPLPARQSIRDMVAIMVRNFNADKPI